MTLQDLLERYNGFFENSHLAVGEKADLTSVIRNGMVMLIPVLLIGAFSLTVQFIPIPIYLRFSREWQGGFINTLFGYISNATFGLMSVLMTFTISYCYMTQYDNGKMNVITGVMTSMVCYFILIGAFTAKFNTALLGSQGVASAIICSMTARSRRKW